MYITKNKKHKEGFGMITQLRGQFKGVIYKYSLWVLAGALVLGYVYIPVLFKNTQNDSWALKVNNVEIPYKFFVQEVEQKRSIIEALRMQYGQYADMLLEAYGLSSDPRAMAYHTIVRNEVLKQKINTMGIVLGESYIADLANDQQFLRGEFGDIITGAIVHSNKNDASNICTVLKHFGFTTEDFERKIEDGAQRTWVSDLLTMSMVVPMYDISQQYVTQFSPKKYGILSISRDVIKKEIDKMSITEKSLRDFFAQQNLLSKKYWIGEQRSGMAWRLAADSYNVIISDEQIADYYKQHAATKYVDTPVMIQIRKIVFMADNNKPQKLQEVQKIHAQLIAAPSTFSEVAKQVSEDSETKNNGGLMPFFKKGEQDRVIERAGLLLNNPGDISNIIETNTGFVIIQLVEKRDKVLKPLSQVSKLIKDELTAVAFKKLFAQDLSVSKDIVALEKLMLDKKITPIEIKNVSATSQDPMAKKLFQLRSIGAIGSYVDGAKGVIVMLKSIEKPFEQSFDQVEGLVKEDLLASMVEKKLEEYQKSIVAMIAQGKTIQETSKSFAGAVYQETDFIAPDNRKALDAALAGKARATLISSLEKKGSIAQEIGHNGLVAVQIIAVEPIKKDQFDQAVARVESELLGARSHLVLEGFVASLYKNAKIETNEAVFSRC